jgi:hypothetical protein
MSNKKFDPITVEAQLVQAKILPTRADTPPTYLGTLEQDFTEHDPRKWALWRISMVRQFQPAVLGQMSPEDLLYLAGQSSEGYIGKEVYGIQADRNKVAQNAVRARVELDTRATRGDVDPGGGQIIRADQQGHGSRMVSPPICGLNLGPLPCQGVGVPARLTVVAR